MCSIASSCPSIWSQKASQGGRKPMRALTLGANAAATFPYFVGCHHWAKKKKKQLFSSKWCFDNKLQYRTHDQIVQESLLYQQKFYKTKWLIHVILCKSIYVSWNLMTWCLGAPLRRNRRQKDYHIFNIGSHGIPINPHLQLFAGRGASQPNATYKSKYNNNDDDDDKKNKKNKLWGSGPSKILAPDLSFHWVNPLESGRSMSRADDGCRFGHGDMWLKWWPRWAAFVPGIFWGNKAGDSIAT